MSAVCLCLQTCLHFSFFPMSVSASVSACRKKRMSVSASVSAFILKRAVCVRVCVCDGVLSVSLSAEIPDYPKFLLFLSVQVSQIVRHKTSDTDPVERGRASWTQTDKRQYRRSRE